MVHVHEHKHVLTVKNIPHLYFNSEQISHNNQTEIWVQSNQSCLRDEAQCLHARPLDQMYWQHSGRALCSRHAVLLHAHEILLVPEVHMRMQHKPCFIDQRRSAKVNNKIELMCNGNLYVT